MNMVIKQRLNTIIDLDSYLEAFNHNMQIGDHLQCHAITAVTEHRIIQKKYPTLIQRPIIALNYLWHRIMSKLHITKHLYYIVSGGRRRTYSRTEILGRICRAGFKIEEEHESRYLLRITACKVGYPIKNQGSHESLLIKLKRRGKGGKMITVYKLRTMHSYAQYLQSYVYEHNSLQEGGKMANDFRVNFWGRLMRPLWLDELPMIWNVLRGDMKLFGVRPLSEQYFSLYEPEMQELRIKVKPGLIPPFYYEKESPKTLEEIEASERRYIEAYLRHPIRTDWRYFWGTLANIIFRHKRSR